MSARERLHPLVGAFVLTAMTVATMGVPVAAEPPPGAGPPEGKGPPAGKGPPPGKGPATLTCTVFGTEGPDDFGQRNQTSDVICGLGGDDGVSELGPEATFIGGEGVDRVDSLSGAFIGGPGDDFILTGTRGTFIGGAGSDRIVEAVFVEGFFDGGDDVDCASFVHSGAEFDGGKGNDWVGVSQPGAILKSVEVEGGTSPC